MCRYGGSASFAKLDSADVTFHDFKIDCLKNPDEVDPVTKQPKKGINGHASGHIAVDLGAVHVDGTANVKIESKSGLFSLFGLFTWSKTFTLGFSLSLAAQQNLYTIIKLIDLSRAPYVLYGVKYIDLVSLSAQQNLYTILKFIPPLLFFKMACKQNLDLRCVLISDPGTLGAGAKTRLHTPKAVSYYEQPNYV